MTGEPPPARLRPVPFARLAGWADDALAPAFAAFRRSAAAIASAPPKTKPLGPAGDTLLPAAQAALALPPDLDDGGARRFFQRHFTARRIVPATGTGFVTGYFEPEVAGSRTRSDAFPVPLYAMPPDLVELGRDDDRTGLDPALTWARRLPDGRLTEHPDRAAIMAGALEGIVPAVGWVASWVEAFFIHVQGSARLRLADGETLRVGFAGKSGHVYFPIARVLVERGLMPASEATADVLKRWLLDHPEDAAAVMGRNRSFIFFRASPPTDPALGPIAAAGVPLTPGRSLAIDRHLVTFHVPIFVDSRFDGADGPPFRRLMIAQDTGSAIVGPARGDVFFGSGEAAWLQAARVRHPARFTMLVPRRRPAGGP